MYVGCSCMYGGLSRAIHELYEFHDRNYSLKFHEGFHYKYEEERFFHILVVRRMRSNVEHWNMRRCGEVYHLSILRLFLILFFCSLVI